MNQQKNGNGILKVLLGIGIFFAVVSVALSGKAGAPEDMSAIFPAAEEITYLSVTAEGEQEGSNVTREQEVIAGFTQVLAQTTLADEVSRYVGKKYEGTLYTITIGSGERDYSISLASDGSVFHSNGKLTMENPEALCQWLADFCVQ